MILVRDDGDGALGSAAKLIRVVAADDSALVRGVLAQLFASQDVSSRGAGSRVELCAVAEDGATCVRVVRAMRPDVVVLDLEMPGLSGLDTIAQLRAEWPTLPIIMFSAYTARGAATTMEALARGATDYVTKPRGQRDAAAAIATLRGELLPKIVALAVRRHTRAGPVAKASAAKATALSSGQARVVGIGASTGGPAALEKLLAQLPGDFAAPIVIVQHMPKLFTNALSERLNECCALEVRLGEERAEVLPGTVWLAPGDRHMEVFADGAGVRRLTLKDGPPVQHCRPAVDPMLTSLARCYGADALGVVMTGMGSDGLEGARAIVAAGGKVLAQDEASSAVWGMPGRVATEGVACAVVPLASLANEMVARTGRRV
jgi:two-component system chemotaxis response regulator CheB